MTRREFVGVAGSSALFAAARKPNIIVIVADDLGWADLGVQGCKDIPTPNVDSLAKNGARFTNGYVSCPVCSPTRAGLMTGRYQQRFGHEFNPGPGAASPDFGLPPDEITLANRLKAGGYATGMVGKWHLGFKPELQPMRRGFDEFFGFLGGAHPYNDAGAESRNPILRGTKPVDEKEYLTDAFSREALAFVDRRRENPFFLYWTFNAVHAPMNGHETYARRFAGTIPDEKRRTFAGMLTALDDAVGRMLLKLRELKLENDTLIFFISDNGGPTPVTTSLNTPLRGTKATVWEGGIRVPFLVQWRGTIKPGTLIDHPVISLDILPTAVAASGGEVGGKLDGVDRIVEGVPQLLRLVSQRLDRLGDLRAVDDVLALGAPHEVAVGPRLASDRVAGEDDPGARVVVDLQTVIAEANDGVDDGHAVVGEASVARWARVAVQGQSPGLPRESGADRQSRAT